MYTIRLTFTYFTVDWKCRPKDITNDATLGPRTLCLILWLVGFMSNFRVKNDVLSAYKIFHFEIKSYLQDLYFICWTPPLLQNPGSACVGLNDMEH